MPASPVTRQAAKQAGVVRAATGVFLRYGFARTTMGDVAAAAGISRPALYLVFPSKEGVFAAVITRMDAAWHAETRAALSDYPGLEAQLGFACERWGLHGYDVVAAHPDARDLFDLNFPAVREMYGHFQGLIAEIITPAVPASGLDASAPELARALAFAIRGFRETVESRVDAQRLIALEVRVLSAALNARRPRQVPVPARPRARTA